MTVEVRRGYTVLAVHVSVLNLRLYLLGKRVVIVYDQSYIHTPCIRHAPLEITLYSQTVILIALVHVTTKRAICLSHVCYY